MSTALPFKPVIEPLGDHHDRAAFHCGNESLDRYFHQQARQDLVRHVSAPHVLVDNRSGKVAGYYTLSSYQIAAGDLPPELARRFPRYPYGPATLLGRLAVDAEYQGQGLGKLLLMDAVRRSWETNAQVASMALVVDAIDDNARAFYEAFGFIRFPDHPDQLFLPMATIAKLFPEPAKPPNSSN